MAFEIINENPSTLLIYVESADRLDSDETFKRGDELISTLEELKARYTNVMERGRWAIRVTACSPRVRRALVDFLC